MNANQYTKTIQQDVRIDNYLKGLMTKDEENSFLADLENNPKLRSKAIVTARIVKAMQSVGSNRDQKLIASIKGLASVDDVNTGISSIINGKENKSNAPRILFMSRKKFVSISIAASVLACIWGGCHIYDNRQMEKLGAEYLAYFPMSKYSRGSGITEDKVTSEIARLYKSVETNDNIDGAIINLERIWSLSLNNEYNDYTDYSSQIGWILANAYVRTNEKNKAIETLQRIINNQDNTPVFKDKAKELKNKIENRKIF